MNGGRVTPLVARIRFGLFLALEWWRATVRVEPGHTLPRLHFPEPRRRAIQWTTTVIACVGVLLSIVSLPRLPGILVTLVLFVLERTLNSVVYRFHRVLFVPRPIDQDLQDLGFDHLAILQLHGVPAQPPVLLLGFGSCDGAAEVFRTMAAWCGRPAEGVIDDREQARIGLSIVFEGTQTYRVFLYRSLTLPPRQEEQAAPDAVEEVVQINVIRTRHFPVTGPWPAAYEIANVLGGGREYVLAAARVEDGRITPCDGLPRFRKKGLRVKAECQLKRGSDLTEFVFYRLLESRGGRKG